MLPAYIEQEKPEADTYASSFSDALMEVSADGIWSELATLRHLEEDWDGYGAPKLNPSAIDDAEAFLNLLVGWDIFAYPPTPMPLSDGTLALHWDFGGKYLEIGFDGDSHPYLLFLDQRIRRESHPRLAMTPAAWRASEILKDHFIDFESALAA